MKREWPAKGVSWDEEEVAMLSVVLSAREGGGARELVSGAIEELRLAREGGLVAVRLMIVTV